MYREEILDMAMDILDNTDATLEEAMGVALESQMRKMKAEARKTGDWSKVANRQRLTDRGRSNAVNSARRDAFDRSVNRSDAYRDRYARVVDRAARGVSKGSRNYIEKRINDDFALQDDRSGATRRSVRRNLNYPTSVSANNGRGTQYPKASKEAAIMDTALDFLDMYDVSLEEAIDMAYDCLIG